MIKYCQYCAIDMERRNNIPFVTCLRCKRQRATILREVAKRRKFDKETRWICGCNRRQLMKEPYCSECLAFRKDCKKISIKK